MTAYKRVELPALETQYYSEMRPFDRDLLRELIGQINNLDAILNGGIHFSDNVNVKHVSYTSNAVANTEDTVAHLLGKVPAGYIIYSLDKGAVVYSGGTAFTKTNIYLKCNTASTAIKLMVF